MEKREIKVEAFCAEDCEYDIPKKHKEFIDWWLGKIDLVPKEYKDTALVEIESGESYGSTNISVKVSYYRFETHAELTERILKAKQQQQWRENQELCELERLKEKYSV